MRVSRRPEASEGQATRKEDSSRGASGRFVQKVRVPQPRRSACGAQFQALIAPEIETRESCNFCQLHSGQQVTTPRDPSAYH